MMMKMKRMMNNMQLTMNVKINFAFASFLTDMSSIVASLTHVQRVRILFKTCLRLHRGLPTQMQIIGDAYVRDEFKRHKAIDNPAQIASFMEAWAVSIFKRKKKFVKFTSFFTEICSDNISTNRC